jgi:SAM-dependent methyltransferase
MKNWLSFLLFVSVGVHAQDASKPAVPQPEPGAADYYGAYAPGAEPQFNRSPNAFLIECVRNRRPGKALDVGMGSGRNSLYLASHGWDVTGFDIANVGVAQARHRAKKLGVKLNAIVKSDADFDFGTKQWDLIVLTYQPFRELLAKMKPSLRDGGIIVIENFHRDTMRDRLLDEDATFGNNELLDFSQIFGFFDTKILLRDPTGGSNFPRIVLYHLKRRTGIFSIPGATGKASQSPQRRPSDGE